MLSERKAEIGIVVPVYKVKKVYLDACVESLVNQTFKNLQIVLVDDCSPDDCGKWCEEYAQADSRIKVVHHDKNRGLPSARNTGLEHLNAKWVTFVDSDDWLDLDSCEKMMGYLQKWQTAPDMIIFTGYRNHPELELKSTQVFDNETWFCGREEIEELQKKSLLFTHKSYPVGAMNLDSACWRLISMDFIQRTNLRFIDVSFREDGLFFLYSTELADKIVYVYEPLYHYRDTGSSMVNMYRPKADIEHRTYLDEVWKFIEKYNKSDEFVSCVYSAVLLSMQICITQKFFHKENKAKHFERQKACRAYLSQEPYASALKKINYGSLRRNHKIKAYLMKWRMYGLLSIMKNLYNAKQKKESFN